MRALPLMLLGKRIAVQPDLDTNATSLVYGKSLTVPGQLLGHPGPPLSNLQTRALLEELYKMSAKPAIPTSATVDPVDLSYTESATHVYIKVDKPKGLSPKWEGPYLITSRPSRSQIEVRLGSFVDGTPRLQKFHWNTCKIAHLRPDMPDASRPKLGRPTSKTSNGPNATEPSNAKSIKMADEQAAAPTQYKQTQKPAKIQTSFETLCGKAPLSDYIKKGPIFTREMFDKWSPELLGLPETSIDTEATSRRPVRSTRNPNPNYVDAISGHFASIGA